ncbi:hypothetical protein [Marinicella litoralis]|nr:hypothetical protein [Marinicella litoralis]
MKKNDLKKLLPSGFENSKLIKHAVSLCRNNIELSVRLETSDFWELSSHTEVEKKIVIIVSIEIYDKYSKLYEKNIPIHIIEASVSTNSGKMILVDEWSDLQHWETDDISGLANCLDNCVIPWINWIMNPKVMIEYLSHIEHSSESQLPEKALEKFESILIDIDIKFPKNNRKGFNGAIASIYEAIGEVENSLKHLKIHQFNTQKDYRPTKIESINQAYQEKLELIEEGIRRLENKLVSE